MSKSSLGRTLTALVMVLALAGTTNLVAQRAKIGVGGGPTIPMGDFGDSFKTGWHGQVNVLFDLPALPFDIRVDGQYGEHKVDASVSSDKAKLITGMVGAQLPLGPPGSPAKPYLTGGVGITNFDFDSGSPGVSGSSSDFMIGGGGGVTFSVGSVSLFVEARLMNVFSEGSSTTFLPITGGILFGGK